MANKSIPYTVVWNWQDEGERLDVPAIEYVDKATTAERAINKLYARLGEEYGDEFSKAEVLIVAVFPTVAWLPLATEQE